MCDGVFWKARCRYRRLSSSDVHDLEINAPKEDVHHSNPLYAYHFPWILISKRHQYAFQALLFRVRCFFPNPCKVKVTSLFCVLNIAPPRSLPLIRDHTKPCISTDAFPSPACDNRCWLLATHLRLKSKYLYRVTDYHPAKKLIQQWTRGSTAHFDRIPDHWPISQFHPVTHTASWLFIEMLHNPSSIEHDFPKIDKWCQVKSGGGRQVAPWHI